MLRTVVDLPYGALIDDRNDSPMRGMAPVDVVELLDRLERGVGRLPHVVGERRAEPSHGLQEAQSYRCSFLPE